MNSIDRPDWGPGGSLRAIRSCFLTLGVLLLSTGCTPIPDFVRNGFKVGPNYQRPPAPLSPTWIDADNERVISAPANYGNWWSVFRDPVLDDLIQTAYEQNVDLRVAGTRVLEARAQRAIAVGVLFPQQQTATGSFDYIKADGHITDFKTGLNSSWEIDFWGRFRRNIESADGAIEASVEDFDNVMVTLIGDVAATYVQYRIFEQQVVYTRQNIGIQRDSLTIATDRWKAGQTSELGVMQGTSLLEQLEAAVPNLEIGLRQANNQLCTLLGIPPVELADTLGRAPIPESPDEIAIGIPADLIRRRPDIRAAERLVAAQCAQIGIAESDLYPAFVINGRIGYQVLDLAEPIGRRNFSTGSIGPAFEWNILNYGRIINNVRLQDFRTQELAAVYQQKVLSAAREVEDGIITFLNSRRSVEHLAQSVTAAERAAVNLVNERFKAGAIDYTPVFVAQQFLIQQQVLFAQSQGDIALGLIAVYRAVGGGWEFRLANQAGIHQNVSPLAPEALPVPAAPFPGPELE